MPVIGICADPVDFGARRNYVHTTGIFKSPLFRTLCIKLLLVALFRPFPAVTSTIMARSIIIRFSGQRRPPPSFVPSTGFSCSVEPSNHPPPPPSQRRRNNQSARENISQINSDAKRTYEYHFCRLRRGATFAARPTFHVIIDSRARADVRARDVAASVPIIVVVDVVPLLRVRTPPRPLPRRTAVQWPRHVYQMPWSVVEPSVQSLFVINVVYRPSATIHNVSYAW